MNRIELIEEIKVLNEVIREIRCDHMEALREIKRLKDNNRKLVTRNAVIESCLDEERYNLAVANDAISDLMDKNLDNIDRIAELENHIEKLAKRNQDLSDAKYAMHKAYRELEMDLESAEHEIALCHKDIKKLNQKINLKNYLIDKLSRAIMLISK